MRKTTLVNQALLRVELELRIRGLSGDRAHPSPSHVFPRSLAPRNRMKCFMITALNSFGLRNCREMFHPQLLPNCQKRYMWSTGRLNWAIVCPDQQQIGNTFHNPRCILPASRSANFIATQLHFARTTSLSWGKSNLPECPAPQTHVTGHVTCPPWLGAGLWIIICLHNSVLPIAYLPGLHAKYFNIPWRPLGHLRLTLRAGIGLCIVAELDYTFHSSGCVRAQVTRSCHNYNGIIPLVS